MALSVDGLPLIMPLKCGQLASPKGLWTFLKEDNKYPYHFWPLCSIPLECSHCMVWVAMTLWFANVLHRQKNIERRAVNSPENACHKLCAFACHRLCPFACHRLGPPENAFHRPVGVNLLVKDLFLFLNALAFAWEMKFPYPDFLYSHRERGTWLPCRASNGRMTDRMKKQIPLFSMRLHLLLTGARCSPWCRCSWCSGCFLHCRTACSISNSFHYPSVVVSSVETPALLVFDTLH